MSKGKRDCVVSNITKIEEPKDKVERRTLKSELKLLNQKSGGGPKCGPKDPGCGVSNCGGAKSAEKQHADAYKVEPPKKSKFDYGECQRYMANLEAGSKRENADAKDCTPCLTALKEGCCKKETKPVPELECDKCNKYRLP